VTENRTASLQLAGRRPPTTTDASVQQFVSRRLVVPHGDAEYGTESGRIEHEVRVVGSAKENVVRVFVLNHDIVRQDARSLTDGPPKCLFQCLERLGLCQQAGAIRSHAASLPTSSGRWGGTRRPKGDQGTFRGGEAPRSIV
jgi:hypothetical protein